MVRDKEYKCQGLKGGIEGSEEKNNREKQLTLQLAGDNIEIRRCGYGWNKASKY